MMIPWKFFVFLFLIGQVTKNVYADGDPEVIAMGQDDEVGSPLLALKGIKKLKLLGGVKKIKLKLAGLGLKKGLLLGKIPFLGAGNPFGGAGEESIDNYYLGTPEDVGAHMWGSQQFDPNFHPENARYEIEDAPNPAWMHHHQNIHNNPHVGSEHDAEYLPGYYEQNSGQHPEFYRSHDVPHQMPYNHPEKFTYHSGHPDSFEFEGTQESRYQPTKLRQQNKDTYEIKNDEHEQMSTGDMQPVYMKPMFEMRSEEMSTVPGPRFLQTPSHIMLQDESLHHIPEGQYVFDPERMDMRLAHPMEDMKPQLNWNLVKNGQLQTMNWSPAGNSEMLGSANPESDNMSHIQKEEKDVNPVFMQEYIQAVRGFGNEPESRKAQRHFKKNIVNQVKEREFYTEVDSSVKSCGKACESQSQPNQVQQILIQNESRTVSDNTNVKCEQKERVKSQENVYVDPLGRNTQEMISDKKLDIPIRRSIDDGVTSQMAQQQMVAYNNWEAMSRFAPNMQNPQNSQSFMQESSRKVVPSYRESMVMSEQDILPTTNPSSGSANLMSYQQIQNGQERGSESMSKMFDGGRTMSPQTPYMYQQYSETSRSAADEKPEIVLDNNPINAVFLPADIRMAQPMEMFSAQMNSRTNTGMQYAQDQQTQLQYQQPNTDPHDARSMMSDPNSPASGYELQYAPEQQPQTQYRTVQDNAALLGYTFDRSQNGSPAEGQQQFSRTMMNEQPEIQNEQNVGVMGPQIPEHERTFHKKFLFGIKKGLKSGGYDDYGYSGGNYYQSNHGNYGNHGYSHSYYGNSYGYVGQQNPSETSSPQEDSQMQYLPGAADNPMMTTDLQASATTNERKEVLEPQESTCSCAKTWPEQTPDIQDDKRLYMGNPEMVGTPFTTILSRPYLGLWGPNTFLGPLLRPPSFFGEEARFEDGPRDRFQRDNTLIEKIEKSVNIKPIKSLKPEVNAPGMRLKKATPRPYSSLIKERPLFVKYVPTDYDKGCKNECKKDCGDGDNTSKTEKLNIGNIV